jgi:hypothetical protein
MRLLSGVMNTNRLKSGVTKFYEAKSSKDISSMFEFELPTQKENPRAFRNLGLVNNKTYKL